MKENIINIYIDESETSKMLLNVLNDIKKKVVSKFL